MASPGVARRIVDAAGIRRADRVLEVGTGRGILTPMLCGRAAHVVSVEADRFLYEEASSRMSSIPNLTLVHGDGFGRRPEFDVFVSNLPYSHSRRAVEWLAGVPFRQGAIMVQEEFARKVESRGSGRRAVSVVWQGAFEVTESFRVGRRNFDPPPRVDSMVLAIQKRRTISGNTVRAVHGIFSARRKVLRLPGAPPRRLDDIPSDQVLEIAVSV